MPLLEVRDLLSFPNGDNATDTLINGVHFNRTALNHWNYTLYSNGTLSNGSNCWLTFKEYKPSLLLNGTFLNATSCYSPIGPIQGRGIISLVFGVSFGITIIFTLKNLRKHGRLYLADEKRWSAVGRRWQWYWMLLIASCGTISTINGIDVDRNYLQSTSIILQGFFYYLMLPGVLACVWESVRHWGSWQERQICDADPFSLPQDDIRSRTEFYLPLIFYLFDWLLFFMTIPRSWSAIEKQRSPSQALTVARASALDTRFKAGAFFAVAAWITTCCSLCHSIRHYRQRTKNVIAPTVSVNNRLTKLVSGIAFSAVNVGYVIGGTWAWSISPLNAYVSDGWLFGLGYAPALTILIIYNISGRLGMNDDKALAMQRQHRENIINRELGIGHAVQKPSWWSKMSGDHHRFLSPEERLRHLTSEIGSGPATARKVEEALEMKRLGNESSADEEQKRNLEDESGGRKPAYFVRGSTMLEANPPASSASRPGTSTRSAQENPQIIRSMLDV